MHTVLLFIQSNWDSENTHFKTQWRETPPLQPMRVYTTISPSGLRKHIKRKHAGEKPHKCNQCKYTSASSGELQSHMRTHTGEKPYNCNQCNYTSAHVTNLQNHMRRHTGEKPNKCNQCDFTCKQVTNLLRHKRTHTGERFFTCNQCDKTHTERPSLKALSNALNEKMENKNFDWRWQRG